MRIVIISNNYPPVIDGVGDHSFFLSAALRKRGHSVAIICSASKKIIAADHANVYPIVQRWDKEGYKIAFNKIKEISPDYVFLQYVPYGFQRIGVPWRMPFFVEKIHKAGIPCLIHFHEMFVRLSWELKKLYFIGVIQRLLVFQMCKYTSRVVTSTLFYKQELSKLTSKPIEVIPIPPNFDTGLVFNEARILQLRSLISPEGYPIIATFGTRDTTAILAVFKKIVTRIAKVKFLVCGRVNPEVYEELADTIYFTGYLNSEDVPYYLKTAAVFFLPDYADKQGRGGSSRKSGSLAAALFCNLPVVGISGDNNGDDLLRNSRVVLENYYDIDRIAGSILALIKNPETGSVSSDCIINWDRIADMYTGCESQ